MKNPESPRAYPPPSGDPLRVEVREDKLVPQDKLVPRYVQAPALRDHGMGPRNLFWGVAMLFVALVLLVVAVFLTGPKAMVYVATCLLTFTALFVLARMHLFRQRNGGFLALGLVCLIGTMIPLVEKVYAGVKTMAGSHSTASSAAEPVVSMHSSDPEAPLLTQSFALPPPQGEGKQVKVMRDSRVVIADKPFLIRAGDRFPYIAAKGDETTFAVRDLQVSLPTNVVEVIDPGALNRSVAASPASSTAAAKSPTAAAAAGAAKKGSATTPAEDELAELTRSAQQEAMRRYPALAIKDSMENAVFVSTYKQMREGGNDDFFANPEWPLALADMLAKHEGWVPGAGPMTTRPDPVLDPPSGVDPTEVRTTTAVRRTPSNLPPTDTLDAGNDLPRSKR